MLNRRSVLIATGALALNYGLTGCRTNRSVELRVRLLEGSVPAQILKEFQRQFRAGAEFLASKQLADLFKLLETWKHPETSQKSRFGFPSAAKPAGPADLITLGDYWLTAAIQQGLIQPLALETIPGWQQIPPSWQQLVRRDQQGQLSPAGQYWAAPYRWGSLVIAYNVEQFKRLGWTPTDWQDLWRPELKGFLSLPDNARSVIGLTLKQLGQSVNSDNLDAIPDLQPQLQALQQQVKFYSSTDYLQPLILGDSWIAVGWSTEVLPMVERDRRLAAVVPTSGTLLTADLWVRPAVPSASSNSATPGTAEVVSPSPSSVAPPPSPVPAPTPAPVPTPAVTDPFQQWIEFCWQPSIATQLSLLSLAASPVLLATDRSKLPPDLQRNALLLPPTEVIERSEFLLPVSNLAAYRHLWVTMRQTE